ncbi:hypothetical protein BDV41DRAFT_545790 [Aspergillus transmontanensis]|uniref:Uncharacterized protein n=1 Tax=Aspergillus transmontanensis TaxID=1034304 RepID=A0A5N6VP20_9EURO|nr:hypothetical protein BDV41DRAFT_545790 [Aspergillus transmontanensis]
MDSLRLSPSVHLLISHHTIAKTSHMIAVGEYIDNFTRKMDETQGHQLSSNNMCMSNISLDSSRHGCSERMLDIRFNSVTRVLWVRIMPTELHDAHQRWVAFSRSEWRARGLLIPEAGRRMGKKVPDMACMTVVGDSRIFVRPRLNMFDPSISLGKL